MEPQQVRTTKTTTGSTTINNNNNNAATNTIKKWSTSAAESAAQTASVLQNGIGSINGCYKDNTVENGIGGVGGGYTDDDQEEYRNNEENNNGHYQHQQQQQLLQNSGNVSGGGGGGVVSNQALRISKSNQRQLRNLPPDDVEVSPTKLPARKKSSKVKLAKLRDELGGGIDNSLRSVPEEELRRTRTLEEGYVGNNNDSTMPSGMLRRSSSGSNLVSTSQSASSTSAANNNKPRRSSDGGNHTRNKQKKQHNKTKSNKQKVDKYGFFIDMDDGKGNTKIHSNNKKIQQQQKDSNSPTTMSQVKTLQKREKKWNGMMNTWETYTTATTTNQSRNNSTSPATKSKAKAASSSPHTAKMKNLLQIRRNRNKKTLIRRVRKGIPDPIRGKVWCLLCNVTQHITVDNVGYYQKLVHESLLSTSSDSSRNSNKSSNSNSGNNKATTIIKRIPLPQKTRPPKQLSFIASASVQHKDRTISINNDDDDDNNDNYDDRDDENNNGNINGNNEMNGVNEQQTTTTAGTSPAQIRPQSLMKRPSLRPKTVQDAVADASSFRQTQETIERDIHRTFPRHHLFHEYSPDNSDDDDDDDNDNDNLLSSMCDDDLSSCISELEIFDSKNKSNNTNNSSSRRSLASSSASSNNNNNKLDPTTAPGGQASLRRVLRAYSLHDIEVGYCQGMNFIAAMFLTFVDEEEAFWILVSTMNDQPCRMRGMFGRDMKATHKVLYVAEKLTFQFLPRLAKHLEKENIHITMYATQWLLTLFTSSFNFDLVTRVWDCFLAEGWKVVYRVMLALLSYSSSTLMSMSFEDILAYFRELPDLVVGDNIMDIALKIPLKTKHIIKYENEWLLTQQQT